MKKAIYETLGRCFQLIGKLSSEKGRSPKSLSWVRSGFKSSPTEYRVAVDTLENYAINQVFGMWKNSEGKFVRPTPFSKLMRVTPKIDVVGSGGDRLEVEYRRGQKRYLRLTDPFRTTTVYLPFCAFRLNTFYKTAMEVNSAQTGETGRAQTA